MHRFRSLHRALALVALAAFGALPACNSAAIALREKFGFAKREQLVDRVQEARDGQEEAKQQFKSALEQFLAFTKVDGGELEAVYKKLNDEYEASVDASDEVKSRIEKVEAVSDALFKEWEAELDQYSDPALRRSSEAQLSDTRGKYATLLSAMQTAAQKMDPVLANFRDKVLFLKHNLNAQAIASLQQSVDVLKSDVSKLVADMEASIAEANKFIEQMQPQG
ncbi:MAG: DUF2959 domain-containing protein [Planctomycetes bacterium]|nr:DUF2959 domain-containing protein [Planctomycetota bacterium]